MLWVLRVEATAPADTLMRSADVAAEDCCSGTVRQGRTELA